MELIIKDISFTKFKDVQDIPLMTEYEAKEYLESFGYTVLKSNRNLENIKQILKRTKILNDNTKIIINLDKNKNKNNLSLGIPDFFVYRIWDTEKFNPNYFWVEVKTINSGLSESQIRWIDNWKPNKLLIIYVIKT